MSVLNIFPFDDQSTNNMFDIRYQLRLNDLYDFSSTSVLHYQMTMQHLDLSHILVGEKPIRFNQHQNRLYIDMDFENDISVGEFIIIECYRKLDPKKHTQISMMTFISKKIRNCTHQKTVVQIFQSSMVFRCWVVSL